jgi:hypothetical protein
MLQLCVAAHSFLLALSAPLREHSPFPPACALGRLLQIRDWISADRPIPDRKCILFDTYCPLCAVANEAIQAHPQLAAATRLSCTPQWINSSVSEPIPPNAVPSPSSNATYACRIPLADGTFAVGHASRWNGSGSVCASWNGIGSNPIYAKPGEFHVLSRPVTQGCAAPVWRRQPGLQVPDGAIVAGCDMCASGKLPPITNITECPYVGPGEQCLCTYPCYSETAKALGEYRWDPDESYCFYSIGGVVGSTIDDWSLLYLK